MTATKTKPAHPNAMKAPATQPAPGEAKAQKKPPERRRRRASNCKKRGRVGGVFIRDRAGLAHVDLFKALDLCCDMAVEFLATVAKFARVRGALLASDVRAEFSQGPNIPTKLLADLPTMLLAERLATFATERGLAATFSVEELADMQKNLLAGLARHFDAFVLGYGDALRSNRLRERARNLYKMTRGQDVLTDRHIKGGNVPPDKHSEWTANKTNRLVAGMLSLGNESSTRLLLKPASERKRFYVDEIEPRGNKRERS
jgi:hypothetical protein